MYKWLVKKWAWPTAIACRQRHEFPVYKVTDEKWCNIGKGKSKEKPKEEYETEDKPENHKEQIRNTQGPGNRHRRRIDEKRTDVRTTAEKPTKREGTTLV